jgi:RNA-directed DNA polymerase
MGLFDFLKNLFGPPIPRGRAGQSPTPLPAGSRPLATESSAQPKGQPGSRKLNLDVAQFAPLSDSDVKKKARGLGSLWGNPWFGRRDLIPPITDERTLLIDRAMVGHGFITPERLAEIHEVGAQMDKVRPDLALAKEMAGAAVTQDKEDRAALKKRKQAEAAERKKRRAEQILQRKQTDIIFLGRGVSGGLADRRVNVEKLQQLQLPVMASPADLAKALGLPTPRLRWLAFHSEAPTVTHYVRFQVPKRSGGTRELSAPHHDLSACQQWILMHILEKIPVREPAHGFVPGRSTMTNAVPHVGRQVLLNADLKEFFPTITFPRVKGIFQALGYSPAVATILALLCTECPRRKIQYAGRVYHVATGPRSLPQGACTSPALSNLIARRLDARLAGIAKKLGWTYTRYADDLTFSANGESAKQTGYLMARLRHIAADEHFEVNEKKTRVQRPNRAQSVTGIVVNQRPNVSRKVTRRLRAILHRARTQGLPAQNRFNHPHFEAWLRGMLSYIHMVNPEKGKKLREGLEKLPG